MISVDSATLASAKAGDLDAFAAIVRLYQPRCLRFARSMLRNAEDAEEAVQDAWMRVYRALPRYEDQERFDSWLFRILANRCRTRSIRMVRDQRTIIGALRPAAAAVLAPDDAAAVGELIDAWFRRLHLYQRLPGDHRGNRVMRFIFKGAGILDESVV